MSIISHPKLRVTIEPSCTDSNILFEAVQEKYTHLKYLGIWCHNDQVYVYVQNADRMSSRTLRRLLEEHVRICNIAKYSGISGKLHQESGARPARGNGGGANEGKRPTVTKDTDLVVFVHPLGQESLDHITKDFMACTLSQLLNFDFFIKFGLKLYSLEQNINFRARRKYKYVRVLSGREWVTVSKVEAYDRIFENLVNLAREAVSTHAKGLPENHIRHFDTYAQTLFDFKKSLSPDKRRLYERVRSRGLDRIAESVNERLNRLRRWSTKKLKMTTHP